MTIFKREYDAIGFGIARGICEFLGVTFKPIQYILLQKFVTLEKTVKNFKYNGKSTNLTYGIANRGNKQVNCALYVSWALQRAHVLTYKKRIWLGNAVHGNGASMLKSKSKVWHPKRLWYNCDLHIGDIVGFQWGSSKQNLVHTMVLIRFDKGRPVWATCGSSDIKAKDLSRKRRTYEKKPIKTICRLK